MTSLTFCSPSTLRGFSRTVFDIIGDAEWVKKGKVEYANTPAVFDIETSSFYDGDDKCATMYAWVFGIAGQCIRGRTWQEFKDTMDIVAHYYQTNHNRRLIVYVHNLAYEFQWFRHLFTWDKVFALDDRKPVYAITTDGIEFRCSYIQSGFSLAKLGDQLTKYHVAKAVGDLDYRLPRHSGTPLTDTEWGYILNDGLVVMAYIQEEMERLGDITKLPLTKTGYVRQLCCDRCLKDGGGKAYTAIMKRLTIDPVEYRQLKRAYTGGFTHANAHYVGKTVQDVHSFDFTSSYPAVMLSEKYPMSAPIPTVIRDEVDFRQNLKSYCCMFNVRFRNIVSVCACENYISASRCAVLEHPILNNGRVVEASTLTITVTEQDWRIIERMYRWDSVEIGGFRRFRKAYLPRQIIDTVLELYEAKTTLKGVPDKVVEYQVAKGMINSCYGMCVTDPCREEHTYDDQWTDAPADIEQALEAYNKNRQRVLYYPWGVWVTAYARANLFSGILEFGDDYIYSDTDSIKVLNPDRHRDYIDGYNRTIGEKIRRCLEHYGIDPDRAAPITIKGTAKPLGVWDYEGKYDRFKTCGAKRYITETGGRVDITIAGVGKAAGAEFLKNTFGDSNAIFTAFADGLEFPVEYDHDGKRLSGTGKLCHTYIDEPTGGVLVDYLGNASGWTEQSSIHMEPTGYTMGLDGDFKLFLKGIKGGHIG